MEGSSGENGDAGRVRYVKKGGTDDECLPGAARLLCILALILVPPLCVAAQQNPPIPATPLADGEGPLGGSELSVLHGMEPLSHDRASPPIFWAAADYAGPAAFLADSLDRRILRMPILDPALVFDLHFSVPPGTAAYRGIYGIDCYFLGSPSEPRRGRLFILDTTLVSLGGSMDAAFSAKMRAMTGRLGVGPIDLRTSYDLLGANLPQGVDIAVWEKGDRVVFLVMAANAFDGTVSDAQVVCVDRDLWNDYLSRATSDAGDGGRR